MRILMVGILMLVTSVADADAFLDHEVNTGGMTKQCIYDYLGSTYIVTINAVGLCPMSIPVPQR